MCRMCWRGEEVDDVTRIRGKRFDLVMRERGATAREGKVGTTTMLTESLLVLFLEFQEPHQREMNGPPCTRQMT